MAGYTTVEEVIEATGVRPGDFKLESDAGGLSADEKLAALLERWIGHVKGEIDDECHGIDWLEKANGNLDDVPHTIRSVSERAISRWVNQVRSHRDSALIRLDDWRVGIDLVDEVLPQHLRHTLQRHMRSRRTLPLRGFVATGATDDA